MKIFLIKISFLITSTLLFLFAVEFNARKNDHSFLKLRQEYIANNKEEIDVLILGPSHIKRAIDLRYFDYNAISLAMAGSGINVDYLLFESMMNSLDLKLVIMDLSQGYIEKTNSQDWMRSKKLKYYFNIEYNQFKLKDFFFVNYPIYEYLKLKPKKKHLDAMGINKIPKRQDVFKKLGNNKQEIFKHMIQNIKLREKHSRINDTNYKNNTKILRKIVSICRKNNIKVIFISPPKYTLYNNLFNDNYSKRRQAFLSTVIDNETTYFWDYQSFHENETMYFYNINHLNIAGAGLFTKELNQRISLLKILENKKAKQKN